MEHFHEGIQGWFHCEPLYRQMVEQAHDGAVFVEVGAWKGKSAAFMAVEIVNSGKKIRFYVVDNFKGSQEHQGDEAIKNNTLLAQFVENVAPIHSKINLCISDSTEAAEAFPKMSVDFAYIDAAHDYESVKRDIQAWLPRMKPGGLLAGDDYDYWPGVRQAVDDLLPDAIHENNIWQVRCEVRHLPVPPLLCEPAHRS